MIKKITDDFDLKKIAESGQCFRWFEAGEDKYKVIHKGKCLIVKKEGKNLYDFSCSEEDFEQIWVPYLDLDLNYRKIRKMAKKEKDPFLYSACEAEKGIRILRQDMWEMLISFIISQNRNIPAIKNSIELISKKAGKRKKDAEGCYYYTFPEPKALAKLTEEELTECKLGYRTSYIKKTAEAVASGCLDLEAISALDCDSCLEELLAVYGVGKKVASCIMLFGFHMLDSFPIDVWIKRILENEYPNGYPYDDYRPYNGIFQQYMFAYYRNREN